jgi:hypothetical protein
VPPRKWLALLALLSFFFQSLAVQTHIHPQLSQPAAKAAQAPKSAPAPLKNQEPTDQCRLCQEMVHAGHMVTPSAVAAFASLSLVTAIFAAQSFGLDQPATAYSWNSRAPPRR